jgi:hypothetical protein
MSMILRDIRAGRAVWVGVWAAWHHGIGALLCLGTRTSGLDPRRSGYSIVKISGALMSCVGRVSPGVLEMCQDHARPKAGDRLYRCQICGDTLEAPHRTTFLAHAGAGVPPTKR